MCAVLIPITVAEYAQFSFCWVIVQLVEIPCLEETLWFCLHQHSITVDVLWCHWVCTHTHTRTHTHTHSITLQRGGLLAT